MPSASFGSTEKFVSVFSGSGTLNTNFSIAICQNRVNGGYISSIEECILEQTDGAGIMKVEIDEIFRPGIKQVWQTSAFDLSYFNMISNREYRLSEIVGKYLSKANDIVIRAINNPISYRYVLTMECVGTGYNY